MSDSVHAFFAKFTPANWIQIGLLLFGMGGAYFKFDARQTRLEELVTQLTKRVDDIDRMGTQSGQKSALVATQIAQSDQSRLTSVESRMQSLEPKVERIDANVQWITDWIKKPNK